MKYLDILHEVNIALNFDTADTAIIGGCDLWTVKAAGSDKKLYKRIEDGLETRYQNLLSAVAGLTPATAAQFAGQLNINRDTPFGTFHEPANRHTFAYLIATLNATHTDYDYANTLNPDEFRREAQQTVMNEIDRTLYYTRPKVYTAVCPEPDVGVITPFGSPIWGSRSWQLLDSEIDLAGCEYYVWEPSDDPFADDGPIWSYHYFLYNKERKRVAYLYIRGISALGNSPAGPTSLMSRFKAMQEESSPQAGSRKRAEYWLGSRARRGLEAYGDSDELDDLVIDHPGDVVDRDELPFRERSLDREFYESESNSDVEELVEEAERKKSELQKKREMDRQQLSRFPKKGNATRALSEGFQDRMEL